MLKAGFLKPTPDGLFVDFSRLNWYYIADPKYKQKYLDYFASQGYAEAEKLPYIKTKAGLFVVWQPSAESVGWYKAVDVEGTPF